MISFMPAASLAAMVPFIESPVITVAIAVIGPIGIVLAELVPVPGMSSIPGIPLGRIPGWRPDNVSGSIRVVRSPAARAEKVIKNAV